MKLGTKLIGHIETLALKCADANNEYINYLNVKQLPFLE